MIKIKLLIDPLWLSPTADCGAPPPPVNGFLQSYTNTTEGSVVVFWCNPGFVPGGEMTAVCGSDSQWTPNPGGVTCSPRPTPTSTQTSTETSVVTPSATPDSTGPGESQLCYYMCNLALSSIANLCEHFLHFNYWCVSLLYYRFHS